jgi:hypothetical protein
MDPLIQPPDSATHAMPPPAPSATAHLPLSTRQSPIDQETIFTNIYNYPWAKDSEFQSGLSSIFRRDDEESSSGATNHDHDNDLDPDLLLQAQCFYFTQYSLLVLFLPFPSLEK